MTLIPIPGVKHLFKLEPTSAPARPTVREVRVASVAENFPAYRRIAVSRVKLACEVAWGLRPVTELVPRHFGPGARSHISARLRLQQHRFKVGLTLQSVHLRPSTYGAGYEVFGSCRIRQGRSVWARAFIGKLQGQQLLTFRILET